MIWLAFVPLGLWSVCDWFTPLVCCIVAFLLLGIENIGIQIEQPFKVGYIRISVDAWSTYVFRYTVWLNRCLWTHPLSAQYALSLPLLLPGMLCLSLLLLPIMLLSLFLLNSILGPSLACPYLSALALLLLQHADKYQHGSVCALRVCTNLDSKHLASVQQCYTML